MQTGQIQNEVVTSTLCAGEQQSLVEFIQQSPLYGLEKNEFERDQSLTREPAP